jgi:hypothetical protein
MNKHMILAGTFFLLLACGQHEAKAPASPAVLDVTMAVPEEEPIPSAEEPALDPNVSYDLSVIPGSANYTTYAFADADNSTNDEQANGAWSANADKFVRTERSKPDVGRAISSSAAVQGSDTTKHFIRVADLRFRVKDVVRATLGIEDIVGAHDGWVTKTQLRSEPRGTTTIPVSEDSLLEVSRYELVNTITLRVPNTALDSTLRQIGRWVDLFDHRNILADDIRLRMMANAMAVRRAKAHSLRVAHAIDDQGRKLKETLSAEEALQASDERRDQGILKNLELADRVTYSTVTVDIYQRTLIRREMIANERSIEGYQPSLWSRLTDALANGWRLVEMAITGLISIWPIVLLLGGSLWLLWRNKGKRKAIKPALMVTPDPPVE